MFPPKSRRKYKRRPGDSLRTWQFKNRARRRYVKNPSGRIGRLTCFNTLEQLIAGYAASLVIPQWMIDIAAEQDRKKATEKNFRAWQVFPFEVMSDIYKDIAEHDELWKELAGK